MTPDQVTAAAAMLFHADKSGVQCGLISSAFPDAELEDAYRIQDALIDLHYTAGRSRIGWKIGLTSRAMQQALGITTPDSGVLLDSMLFQSGDTVAKGRFIQPRIEAEIAFVMGKDIAGAGRSRADVIAATDYVAPCLEILDTRILRADPATGKARIITDTVSELYGRKRADFMVAVGFVMSLVMVILVQMVLAPMPLIIKRIFLTLEK